MALLPNGKFILEKQYRYPYDEVIYEFPAGKCDSNEDPLKTATRELEEETGYSANKVVFLGEIYPSCAYTNEIIYCYFATELEKGDQHLDENEALEIEEFTLDELNELVRQGVIKDAKTLTCLAFFNAKGLNN